MNLLISETIKTVTLLNHLVEKLGYNVETEGFGYDENRNLIALNEGNIIPFEEGLDFLLSELKIVEKK